MSHRLAAWLAWSLCTLTLALIAFAFILATSNRYEPWNLTFLATEVSAALVGGLVASRRPKNPVGWFVVGHALCFSLGEFSRQYAIFGLLTKPESLPLARVMASPPYWIWFPGIILLFSFLPLYFPNGRLLSPRWRLVAWLAVFVAVLLTGLTMVRPSADETAGIPNPLGIEGLQPLFGGVLGTAVASWLALGVLSATSLVVRFGRSRGEERQQIKWVAYAVVLLVTYTLVDQFLLQGLLPVPVNEVLGVLVFLGLWVSIAVAILRYRLYDIDAVVNRTLVYGSLTAMLAATYFGGVTATQGIFRALTGQEDQPQLAIVVSTLVIAALFNPLRRRIQSFIDKRFYRRKYDAAKTLEAFSTKLRDETDLDALNAELVGVVRETLQPAHVSLWLRPELPLRRSEGRE
jgi:hypothetical protein